MHRKYNMNLNTLAKINLAYLAPATIFIKLYSAELPFGLLKNVIIFFALCMAGLYILCRIAVKLFGFSPGMRVAFTNSVLFDNSGNYAIPLNQLLFSGNPAALSVQVLIMSFQSFLVFSYGVISLQALGTSKWKALLGYFKLPVFYALVLGIGLNAAGIKIPDFIGRPLNYVADSMVAIALLTLGAQIANLRLKAVQFPLLASMVLRLLASPAIAFLVITLLKLDGLLAQTLLISSGMPTSVNSAILAQEYRNEEEFSSQTVLFSTLINAFTMTALIFAAKVLY